MADLTMCYGQECPLRLQCTRFRALPDWRQGYAPYDLERLTLGSEGCPAYWPLEPGAALQPLPDPPQE